MERQGPAGGEMPEDLRLWLKEIGLEQYPEIFGANDVDLAVLPELSEEDL